MTYRLGTLGLIAAMVLSLPSYAQDEEPAEESAEAASSVKSKLARKLYVSPMGNYFRAANARGTDDGFGGTITVGKSVTNGLNLELIGQYLVADPKTGTGTAKLTGVGLGAMVFPSNFLPDLYVPISLMRGQVKDNPGPIPDYSTTFFDIGLGYLIGLTDAGTSVRAQVTYRMDAHGRELAGVHTGERKAFYEGIASLGLLIPLGTTAAPVEEPAPVEEAPAEIVPATDTDGDGVPDDTDQCPDTPAGTVVDATGCPVPAEAPPAPECTPPGPGEPIDLNGCKAGEAVVLRGVNFDLDSARLTPNAKTILDGVADALLASQGIKAEVGGHTSSEGSDNYNQILSESRAGAVQNYLVGRGIESGRLTVKGYGETTPIADNSTAEGRELNRRVELKVTDTGAAAEAPAEAPAEETPAETPAEGEVAAEAVEGETPAAEGEATSTEGEAPAEGEAAPAEGEASAEGEAAPAEEAPSEEAPVEEAPAEEAPVEEAPAEGETAPEVLDAQPIQ